VIDRFFVYVHRKADSGDVFYVGKGSRSPKQPDLRAYVREKRSKFWSATVSKHGLIVEVVSWFADEADAFKMERDLIAFYGRRIDGGSLCNLTLGGDGHSGLAPSQETRQKLSDRFSGSGHPNWGKKLSAETCAKKSEALRHSPRSLRGKKLPDHWVENIRAAKFGERNPMHGRCGELHHGSKRVIDRATGASYPSITAAARAAGLSMQGLANMLSGHRQNTTSMELA
jgi:hypothetical protein